MVVNKIDRDGARSRGCYVNDSLDLMMDLGATSMSSLSLHYGARHLCSLALTVTPALIQMMTTQHVPTSRHDYRDGLPAPDVDIDGPLVMQCVTIDHSDYLKPH